MAKTLDQSILLSRVKIVGLVKNYWICIYFVITLWGIKHTPSFFYHNLKKSYLILIIFGAHIPDNWLSNDRSVSYLTQRLLLHYLGKTEQTESALKLTKKLYKISFIRICGHQQPINYKIWLLCNSTSIK